MPIALPKLEAVTTPEDLSKSFLLTIVSAITFLNDEVKAQFYVAPTGAAPANEAEARAEKNYNDEENDASYMNDAFAATIEALLGFKVRDFGATADLSWRTGMVVTPVAPMYRPRTDDGYKIGVPYLVTNQTYGYARSADIAGIKSVKSELKTMSARNDEWTLVTDVPTITSLVEALIAARGMDFINDVLIDTHNSGKSLQSIVEKYLS